MTIILWSRFPSHDGIRAENDLYGGLIFNGSWRLGASDLSLAATGRVSAHHRTGPEDNLNAYTTASLLLAHDRLGVAFGPVYEGAYWLSSSGTHSAQSDVQWAGAKAIWQPFRTSETPLWNGLVLNATAMHTVGPARWVPADEADTRHLVVTGSATWHFRY